MKSKLCVWGKWCKHYAIEVWFSDSATVFYGLQWKVFNIILSSYVSTRDSRKSRMLKEKIKWDTTVKNTKLLIRSLFIYDSKSEFTWKWTLWTPENIKAARNHWKILACYYSYPIKMSLLIITCKYTHDVHGAAISSGGSAVLIWVCNGRFAVCWQYSVAHGDQTAGRDGDDFVWSLAGL